MSPVEPAKLGFSSEGIPYSDLYDDVYHTSSGASAQARHVFLAGNGLPERWRQQDQFVIVETGFGLGNNFLTTWAAWAQDPAACETLHFISVEKHPLSKEDLAAGLRASMAPEELAAQLVARWPLPLPGCHRLEFAGGRLVLSLFFGDAEQLISQIKGRADAIFLDGFAPSRNPEIWSPRVFRALAGISTQHTTLATWSVSSSVRDGLTQAGFLVEKTPGFSGKREMLRGQYRAQRRLRTPITDKRVLIIGAGLAGTSIAERLARRGFTIDLLEAQEELAQGASGNLAGAFRPLPSKDDNPISRITRAGYLYGLQHLENLQGEGHKVLWENCGVLHLARNSEQEIKQQEVIQALGLSKDFLRWVSAAEATRLAGHTASFGGWWFPQGGWIQPGSLCQANLAAGGARIQLHTGSPVVSLVRDGKNWSALDANGIEIARAPQLVLANAHDARRLAKADWLPLRAARGQVSHLPMAQLAPLGVVVCGQGYITPGIGGHAALGASFVVDDFDLALREDEHAENLAKLDSMFPGFSSPVHGHTLEGRVSLRPVSLDRLPMVGQMPASTQGDRFNLDTLPRVDGLWLITGFGSRGLVWSSLCGELLAARMCDEPLPLERSLAESLDPARFIIHPPKNQAFSGD